MTSIISWKTAGSLCLQADEVKSVDCESLMWELKQNFEPPLHIETGK